jgi:hypothetical protein
MNVPAYFCHSLSAYPNHKVLRQGYPDLGSTGLSRVFRSLKAFLWLCPFILWGISYVSSPVLEGTESAVIGGHTQLHSLHSGDRSWMCDLGGGNIGEDKKYLTIVMTTLY